jgi:hypothetical protein
MATDQSKLCTITNNSGKDLVVTLAVNADETTSQDAVITANQQVEILKTSAGNTVIKNGNAATVTLDHNYKPGADETGYVQDYDLIASDSTWLYPLADISVVQQGSNGAASYAPQTLDGANQGPMVQAFNFYQTIAAYPSSQLATDYMNALVQARDAASSNADGSVGSAKAVADAIENTMDSFFKGTDQYKDVTLADIVAVDNYYNNFPCVWAQYRDSITYYLYGTDGRTAVFSGTLTLYKAGAIDITQPNSGYTCSFAPAMNPADTSKTDVDATRSVGLTYSEGLFLDDATVTTPAIGFRGSFLLERLFTNDPDNNAVIVVLTGTVNGVTCIGFDSPQPSPPQTTTPQIATPTALTSSPAAKYWDTLIHPKNQQDLIVSILTLVCSILLIPATAFAIYGIYRFVKYKQQKKETASKEEVEYKEIKLSGPRAEGLERGWVQVGGTGEIDYDNLTPDQIADIKAGLQAAVNLSKAYKLVDAFSMQDACLQNALKYSQSLGRDIKTLIQDSMSAIRASVENLSSCSYDDLGAALSDAYISFSAVQDNLQKISIAVNNYLTDTEKAKMETNTKESTTIFDDLQRSTKKDKEEESETDPDLENKIIPEEEISV